MSSVLVVCSANYCRSPVAEQILKSILDEHTIDSAGTSRFFEASMDPRSRAYLDSISIPREIHVPKEINKNLILSHNLILAMDIQCLIEIKHKFHKEELNLKLFASIYRENLSIEDPYKYEDSDEYNRVMNQIKDICYSWAKELKTNKY